MVELKVKLGPKGQIVIPKIFRNLFKLYPGGEVIITIEKDKGVLIKKTEENVARKFEEMAREASKKVSPNKIKKILDEQYEEKYKKWAKQ